MLEPQFPLTEKQAKKVQAAVQARINGRKSQGPITPQGKANSSRSSIRHGLTASNPNTTLISGENPAQYQEVYDAWLANLRPADKAELRLVEKLINLDWRLERFAMMETTLFNMSAAHAFEDIAARFERIDAIGVIVQAWKESSSTAQCITLLHRYLTTLQNQFNATMKNFRDLEKRRPERKDKLGPYKPPVFITFDIPERTTHPNEINMLEPTLLRPAA